MTPEKRQKYSLVQSRHEFANVMGRVESADEARLANIDREWLLIELDTAWRELETRAQQPAGALVTAEDLADVERLSTEASGDGRQWWYERTPEYVEIGYEDGDPDGHADDEPRIGGFEREEDARLAVRYRMFAPKLTAEVRRLWALHADRPDEGVAAELEARSIEAMYRRERDEARAIARRERVERAHACTAAAEAGAERDALRLRVAALEDGIKAHAAEEERLRSMLAVRRHTAQEVLDACKAAGVQGLMRANIATRLSRVDTSTDPLAPQRERFERAVQWMREQGAKPMPCGHKVEDLIGGTEKGPDGADRPTVTKCGACLALRQGEADLRQARGVWVAELVQCAAQAHDACDAVQFTNEPTTSAEERDALHRLSVVVEVGVARRYITSDGEPVKP